MSTKTRITVLNSMAGCDFERSLDQHLAWGLDTLDLKDCIYGKSIADLSESDACNAADAISRRKLTVYCLSTSLFSTEMEMGEAQFRKRNFELLGAVLATAKILKPHCIRLIAAQTLRRKDVSNSISYIREQHPWLMPLYSEAIDQIHAAGFKTVIENEVANSIFASAREVRDFFSALGSREKVSYTWDVANLWQLGVFPTLEVYAQLKDFIGYVHVKGSMGGVDNRFAWASSLEDATWPVKEIVHAVIRDGVSPAICLNPPHGSWREGYDSSNLTERDLKYLKKISSL
jgi:hypothetical protein